MPVIQIQKNDHLYKLFGKLSKAQLESIASLNNRTVKDLDLLHPGDKLTLPDDFFETVNFTSEEYHSRLVGAAKPPAEEEAIGDFGPPQAEAPVTFRAAEMQRDGTLVNDPRLNPKLTPEVVASETPGQASNSALLRQLRETKSVALWSQDVGQLKKALVDLLVLKSEGKLKPEDIKDVRLKESDGKYTGVDFEFNNKHAWDVAQAQTVVPGYGGYNTLGRALQQEVGKDRFLQANDFLVSFSRDGLEGSENLALPWQPKSLDKMTDNDFLKGMGKALVWGLGGPIAGLLWGRKTEEGEKYAEHVRDYLKQNFGLEADIAVGTTTLSGVDGKDDNQTRYTVNISNVRPRPGSDFEKAMKRIQQSMGLAEAPTLADLRNQASRPAGERSAFYNAFWKTMADYIGHDGNRVTMNLGVQ